MQREHGSALAVVLFARLTLALGRRATRWLLHPICWYFQLFAPSARRASRAYLCRALGRPARRAEVVRHFYTFAATLHDRLFLLSDGPGVFDIEIHGAESAERALCAGKGCILLGSHLGSFEMVRALASASGIPPVNVVMHWQDVAHTTRVLSRIAPHLRARVIAPGRPETVLQIKECLERGEIVGMLGDRPFRGARTHVYSFLGARAEFPLGPLLIAAASGAPVITFFGLYEGGTRYRICLEPLSDGGAIPRAQRTTWAIAQLARYVERLEAYARHAPYNWFNFYDFWNEGCG